VNGSRLRRTQVARYIAISARVASGGATVRRRVCIISMETLYSFAMAFSNSSSSFVATVVGA